MKNVSKKRILIEKLLREDLLTKSNVLDTKWQPKQSWSGELAKVEDKLIEIGALPFPGSMMDPDKSPAHYELIIQTPDGVRDRLMFYHSGTVYSGNESKNLNVKINSSDEIELLDSANSDKVAGTITSSNNKFLENGINKSVATFNIETVEADSGNDVIDTIQTILDFAGFIPVIGDFIDILNAIIYFARGKYLDGFLSCIAIIPIIGSVAALALKTAFKPFKWVARAIGDVWAGTKSADEIWLLLKNSEKISPEQLKLISEGLVKFGDDVAGFRGFLSRSGIPGLNSKQAGETLEQFENFCKANGRSIDDVLSAAKKTGVAVDAGKMAFKTTSNIEKGMFRGLRKRIEKFNIFPKKKIEALSKALDARFIRRLKNDPKRLASILSTTPNAKAAERLKQDIMTTITTRMSPADANRMYQNLGSVGTDSEAYIKMFDYIKNQPNLTGLYDEIGSTIGNFAMKNDNILYNMYRSSATSNLPTLFSKEMYKFQPADFNFNKNVDVIWNEIQDMGEDAKIELGVSERDDVNGLFYPLLKATLDATKNTQIGEPIDKIRNKAGGVVKKVVQIPIIGGIARQTLGNEKPYVPKDYKVVDSDDPRLQNQEEEETIQKQNFKRRF